MPSLLPLLSLSTGLLLSPFLFPCPELLPLPLFLGAAWIVFRKTASRWLTLSLFSMSLGVSLYHLNLSPPTDPSHIRAFVSQDPIIIEGTIERLRLRPMDRTQLDLKTESIIQNGLSTKVHGRLRVYIGEKAEHLTPGTRIRFRGKLRTPRAFGTPGEFNYARHLARDEIFVTTFTPSLHRIVTFAHPYATFSLAKLQSLASSHIESSVSSENSGLLRALITGDKSGITQEQRTLLSKAGLSHLFAISGLHLGMMGLFLYTVSRWLYCRSERLMLWMPPRRILPLAILPILFAYLLLTGNALSTRRAMLMLTGSTLMLTLSRRTFPLSLLSTGAFLILISDPLSFFNPGLQLSFSGVLGLVILYPRWKSKLPDVSFWVNKAGALFLGTLAATLTTAPLVLLHFHTIAPAGLFTNIVAIPAISFVALPLGTLALLLTTVWPLGSKALLWTCSLTVNLVLDFATFIINLPMMGGINLYLSPAETLYCFLLTLILILPPFPARNILSKGGAAAMITLLLMLSKKLPEPPSLTVLSVGQGDSMVLSTGDEKHYLIDGGGLYSDSFDTGERLVAPALGWLGIKELEAVILSHDHPDHSKGLPYILRTFPVKDFWSSAPIKRLNPNLKKTLAETDVNFRLAPKGWTTLSSNSNLEISLFNPWIKGRNLNDQSLALYARHGVKGVLLTGDLEEEGVKTLLRNPPTGPVSLLKLPHHGSRYSEPEKLLDTLCPESAFASAGFNNRYRLPHREVIEILKSKGIPLFRTDTKGSIRFCLSDIRIEGKHWEKGLFR